MANFGQTDGVLEGINRLVTTIAEKEGFKNFILDIIPMSTQGANYMGELYYADIIETGKDTLKLFVKATNTPEKARGMIDANKIYNREVFMYTTMADTFHKLQEKHNIPEHKQFRFPKYYGSNLANCEEVIVLENLAFQGFVLHDRFKTMNWNYTKAGIEEMAKFHAISFALEKEEPQVFEKLIKNNDHLMVMGEDFKALGEIMIQLLPTNIAFVHPENKAKVEKYFEDNKSKLLNMHHLMPLSKNSVLVHGDYRLSNIMVAYKENVVSSLISKYTDLSAGEKFVNGNNLQNNERPVAALKPCDYQTVFYGCPLNDVVYFLFSGTDAEFRRLHFERIIEHYHDSLAAHLRLMSHDINDIYPKSTFYFELKDKMLYGLEIALFTLSAVLIDPDYKMNIADITEIKVEEILNMMPAPVSNLYEERLNGIVRDFVRWGLLK